MASINYRDLADHVRVKPAIIVHSAVGLKYNARGRRRCDHDVPSAVACRRCVRDKASRWAAEFLELDHDLDQMLVGPRVSAAMEGSARVAIPRLLRHPISRHPRHPAQVA